MTLFIDVHDPRAIDALFSLPVVRTNLNPGRPDYFFVAHGDKTIGVERKQTGELLGSLDAVEAQLFREIPNEDYTCLLVEGYISPWGNQCQSWKLAKAGTVMYRDRAYHTGYKALMAWYSRLWREGIPVIQTANLEGTAIALAALFENMQKPDEEHRTFNRLIREKFWIKEEDKPKREFILAIMGLSSAYKGLKFGEEMGAALWDAGYRNMGQLCAGLVNDSTQLEAAEYRLKSGNRIGLAAVRRLRAALWT